MSYALFLGCKIPHHLPAYDKSSRRVLGSLGVKLTDMEFNCCGYPMRQMYFESYVLAAARNLALAESRGLDLLTLCKCCFGSFKTAAWYLREDESLRRMVRRELEKEGLVYSGAAQVKHLLQVLDQEVGFDRIRQTVVKPHTGLRVAALYGCHAMRPSQMTQFDNPWAPSIFDRMVEATGATSLEWEGKLSCCGAPLKEKNERMSRGMIMHRLREAGRAGADLFCTACTHSSLQAQDALTQATPEERPYMPSGTLVYSQLLGLAMGFAPAELEAKPTAFYGVRSTMPLAACLSILG